MLTQTDHHSSESRHRVASLQEMIGTPERPYAPTDSDTSRS